MTSHVSFHPTGSISSVEMSDMSKQSLLEAAQRRRCTTQSLGGKESRASVLTAYVNRDLKVNMPPLRLRARQIAVSGPWLLTQIIAIVIDLVLMFVHRASDCFICGTDHTILHYTGSMAVVLVYCADLVLRIYGFSCAVFFSKGWNVFDACVVIASTGVAISRICLKAVNGNGVGLLRMARVARILRMIRVAAVIGTKSRATQVFARHTTGENKMRYVSLVHDFDLDLTYITENVIGMGVPASNCIVSLYRNPLLEVVRFFERFHPDHYLIVNMCPELPYSSSAFRSGKVECFDVQDHSPPSLADFVKFLGIVERWMSADDENVLAVHCKGGKGRTGSFICAWLLYSKVAVDAEDALHFFALRRTDIEKSLIKGKVKVQGVETPSQVRYVEYIEKLLENQKAFFPASLELPMYGEIILLSLSVCDMFQPALAPNGDEMFIVVTDVSRRCALYFSQVCGTWGGRDASWNLGGTKVRGDIRISIVSRTKVKPDIDLEKVYRFGKYATTVAKPIEAGKEAGCLFYFIFHTAFLCKSGELKLPVSAIDKAHKDPKLYKQDGSVVLRYSFV